MTTRTLQVLLALVDGPSHGYGIRQTIRERTSGEVVLGSGTLYQAVDRLVGQGWIEEVAAPADEPPSGGPRRRFYALTSLGRRELAAELERLNTVVEFARGRRLIEGG